MHLSEKSVENEIREILQSHGELLRGHRVFLFGSRAGDSAGRFSDFDVGVDGSKPLDLQAFYTIEDAFDRMPTLYKVDWVDLNRASPKVRENALREGRTIYES